MIYHRKLYKTLQNLKIQSRKIFDRWRVFVAVKHGFCLQRKMRKQLRDRNIGLSPCFLACFWHIPICEQSKYITSIIGSSTYDQYYCFIGTFSIHWSNLNFIS